MRNVNLLTKAHAEDAIDATNEALEILRRLTAFIVSQEPDFNNVLDQMTIEFDKRFAAMVKRIEDTLEDGKNELLIFQEEVINAHIRDTYANVHGTITGRAVSSASQGPPWVNRPLGLYDSRENRVSTHIILSAGIVIPARPA